MDMIKLSNGKVDALDLGHSEIIDHNNPAVVKYILSATANA